MKRPKHSGAGGRPAHLLDTRSTHVTALAALPALHKDPFDRILIAQAVAEGLDFVTNDEHISAYPSERSGDSVTKPM